MDTLKLLVPPPRPENFGIIAMELAEQTGYSVEGARRLLMRQKDLVRITMMCQNRRVDVFVKESEVEGNDWYQAWRKDV